MACCSPKKQAANRRNAQKSTGPRTPAGKARSKRNALKHGLTVSALDALAAQEVRDLAALLRAEDIPGEALELAQAACDLRRIRQLRHLVLSTSQDVEKARAAVISLKRLERYERRAQARMSAALAAACLRNFGIRSLGRT
jgi:hypothetical protein